MDEVEKLFEKIKAETNGQLDILVNNAFLAVNVSLEDFISYLSSFVANNGQNF